MVERDANRAAAEANFGAEQKPNLTVTNMASDGGSDTYECLIEAARSIEAEFHKEQVVEVEKARIAKPIFQAGVRQQDPSAAHPLV